MRRALGADAVFVLGHAGYYPRFGFQPAAQFGLTSKSARFAPYFFVLELKPDALSSMSGLVEYLPQFDELGRG